MPEKIAGLQKQIEIQRRKSKSATTKSEKDGAIQRRHVLQMQLDYWRGKYERFTMTEVPDGFSNRQGVDIGISASTRDLSEDGLRANLYGQRRTTPNSAECGDCRRNMPGKSA